MKKRTAAPKDTIAIDDLNSPWQFLSSMHSVFEIIIKMASVINNRIAQVPKLTALLQFVDVVGWR